MGGFIKIIEFQELANWKVKFVSTGSITHFVFVFFSTLEAFAMN